MWKKYVLGAFFPNACFSCRKFSFDSVCSACLGEVNLLSGFACSVCKKNFPRPDFHCHLGAYSLLAIAKYEKTISELLRQLKFNRKTEIANSLAPIFRARLDLISLDWKNFLIVPIPLHPKRYRERGFNQAELFAEIVAMYYDQPLVSDILIRKKYTKPQSGLENSYLRGLNLQDSFFVLSPEIFQNKKVLVVDDVFTTGETMNEAIKVLRQAGVVSVRALSVATTSLEKF